jgi:transcription elongation factor S-II
LLGPHHVPCTATDLLLEKAKSIEGAVFADIGGTTQPYPTKMRSLFVNLKDKNNPSLRESVASGEIPVEKFVKMSSQASRSILDAALHLFTFLPGHGV